MKKIALFSSMKIIFSILGFFILIPWVYSSSYNRSDSLLIRWELEKDTSSIEHKQTLLYEIAESYFYNIPDSALVYFNKALDIAFLSGDRKQESNTRMRIGGTYYILGEYNFALDNYYKGLTLSREINYKKGIALGLNGIGKVYYMHGREKHAMENHFQSIEICKEIGDSLLWARNLHNIGLNLDGLKKYDSALLIADSAIHMLALIGNTNEQIKLNVFKGWIYFNMADYRKAETVFLRVIQNTTYDNKWEISYAYLGLASLNQKLGNITQSIKYGLQSLKLAQEVGALWDIQQSTSLLAKNYSLDGNFENAFQYQLLFKTYSDSIFNQAKEKEINYLQLQHQEDENIRLIIENELNQQKLIAKDFQIIVFSTGLGILIILAFVLYRQIIQKNRMNQKLARLNAEKDKFFSIIAHDLKSPFNSILGFSKLLVEDIKGKEHNDIEKYAETIQQSSQRAMDLLANLMEWSRSQTGRMKFEPKSVEIGELINNVTLLLSSAAEKKSITITKNSTFDILIYADKDMISTILLNLISNAIKFTDEAGEIIISVDKNQDELLISVKDNGVGIRKDMIEKIFSLDQNYSTPGTNDEKGTGLGLILCWEFVEKHNGRIWVESEEGRGSIFHFTIPHRK